MNIENPIIQYSSILLAMLAFVVSIIFVDYRCNEIQNQLQEIHTQDYERDIQVEKKIESLEKDTSSYQPIYIYRYITLDNTTEKEDTEVTHTSTNTEVSFSPDEKELLAGIVHAEAGNQDFIGKRLIADVVLNRMESIKFPNTVSAVINQPGQFTTPSSKYTAEDMAAVDAELNERLDEDVIYFRTNYYHSCGVPAYQHGDHFFNKLAEKTY